MDRNLEECQMYFLQISFGTEITFHEISKTCTGCGCVTYEMPSLIITAIRVRICMVNIRCVYVQQDVYNWA